MFTGSTLVAIIVVLVSLIWAFVVSGGVTEVRLGGNDISLRPGNESGTLPPDQAVASLASGLMTNLAKSLQVNGAASTEFQSLLDANMGKVVELYRLSQEAKQPDSVNTSRLVGSIIATSVLSIGVVSFIVLLIQIALSFMRCHLQLAELYEAQADALRASGGDLQAARDFMDKFSPTVIPIGKMPTSYHEKLIDAVRDLARRPPPSG